MKITIYRPNGEKVWEHIVGPNINLPTMAAEEDGTLHVLGLEQYPAILPPWKIEIEPVIWGTPKEEKP